MTYVGKGICDVDSGRDDAAGVDLRGRFAVMIAGAADGLPPRWRGTAYHAPLDKLDQRDPPIDFDSGVAMARVVYLTVLDVANADQRPRWNPGDVFAPR
jgi:hypothetical protein